MSNLLEKNRILRLNFLGGSFGVTPVEQPG
jgi:hypothetical protein